MVKWCKQNMMEALRISTVGAAGSRSHTHTPIGTHTYTHWLAKTGGSQLCQYYPCASMHSQVHGHRDKHTEAHFIIWLYTSCWRVSMYWSMHCLLYLTKRLSFNLFLVHISFHIVTLQVSILLLPLLVLLLLLFFLSLPFWLIAGSKITCSRGDAGASGGQWF